MPNHHIQLLQTAAFLQIAQDPMNDQGYQKNFDWQESNILNQEYHYMMKIFKDDIVKEIDEKRRDDER